jgi:hypothetical protein
MNPEQAVFAFFPYLITRERPRIRDIEFRSNKDIADLPSDVQEHLTTLSEMFFLQDGVRIGQMVCAYLELPKQKEEQEETLRRLHEARLLVGYLYSHPHPSGSVFLPFENSTLFVFRIGDSLQPGMVPTSMIWPDPGYGERLKRIDGREIPNTMLVPGYAGTRNQRTQLWTAKGSRIYPEVPHSVLNHTQDLALNLNMFLSHAHQWALWTLYFQPNYCPPDLRKRVFVSIDWYMRSCRDSLLEAEAIVHLAIALESLLHARSGEGIRERLKDAVLTLLGPVTHLENWVDQFYTARSNAVHEGIPSDLMFYPLLKKSPKSTKGKKKETPKNKQDGDEMPHRSLLAYGRRIFRLCVSTVLAGAMQARITRLDALFVRNAERIGEIRELLTKGPSADRCILSIEQLVNELNDHTNDLMDPDAVAVKDVVWVTKLALQSVKDAVPTISEPVKKVIDDVISSGQGDPTVALLEKIEECARQLRSGYSVTDRSPLTRIIWIVIALLDYASRPAFKLQCYYRENPRRS